MTVVFSVIFPSNLPFFPSFLRSLESQTNKDFKLILFNDGVSDLEKYLQNTFLKIQSYDVAGIAPFEIRLAGLQKLLDIDAKYVIFADTDDLLSPERLDLSVKYLKTHPFVCNDISLITFEEKLIAESYWSSRIADHSEFNICSIKTYNIMGLGNSAMQCRMLPPVLKKVAGSESGNDWLFFSAAGDDLNGLFISECKTLYRQHEHNLIGKKEVSPDGLLAIIDRKIQHYQMLERIHFSGYDVKEQIEINKEIKAKCNADRFFLNEQVRLINSLGINFFWWEESNYIN